jgi:hypothetical protein
MLTPSMREPSRSESLHYTALAGRRFRQDVEVAVRPVLAAHHRVEDGGMTECRRRAGHSRRAQGSPRFVPEALVGLVDLASARICHDDLPPISRRAQSDQPLAPRAYRRRESVSSTTAASCRTRWGARGRARRRTGHDRDRIDAQYCVTDDRRAPVPRGGSLLWLIFL